MRLIDADALKKYFDDYCPNCGAKMKRSEDADC